MPVITPSLKQLVCSYSFLDSSQGKSIHEEYKSQLHGFLWWPWGYFCSGNELDLWGVSPKSACCRIIHSHHSSPPGGETTIPSPFANIPGVMDAGSAGQRYLPLSFSGLILRRCSSQRQTSGWASTLRQTLLQNSRKTAKAGVFWQQPSMRGSCAWRNWSPTGNTGLPMWWAPTTSGAGSLTRMPWGWWHR